jgi:hypothetical protein
MRCAILLSPTGAANDEGGSDCGWARLDEDHGNRNPVFLIPHRACGRALALEADA